MPPAPPDQTSPDDILELSDLVEDKDGRSTGLDAASVDMTFEQELEELFSEDLAADDDRLDPVPPAPSATPQARPARKQEQEAPMILDDMAEEDDSLLLEDVADDASSTPGDDMPMILDDMADEDAAPAKGASLTEDLDESIFSDELAETGEDGTGQDDTGENDTGEDDIDLLLDEVVQADEEPEAAEEEPTLDLTDLAEEEEEVLDLGDLLAEDEPEPPAAEEDEPLELSLDDALETDAGDEAALPEDAPASGFDQELDLDADSSDLDDLLAGMDDEPADEGSETAHGPEIAEAGDETLDDALLLDEDLLLDDLDEPTGSADEAQDDISAPEATLTDAAPAEDAPQTLDDEFSEDAPLDLDGFDLDEPEAADQSESPAPAEEGDLDFGGLDHGDLDLGDLDLGDLDLGDLDQDAPDQEADDEEEPSEPQASQDEPDTAGGAEQSGPDEDEDLSAVLTASGDESDFDLGESEEDGGEDIEALLDGVEIDVSDLDEDLPPLEDDVATLDDDLPPLEEGGTGLDDDALDVDLGADLDEEFSAPLDTDMAVVMDDADDADQGAPLNVDVDTLLGEIEAEAAPADAYTETDPDVLARIDSLEQRLSDLALAEPEPALSDAGPDERLDALERRLAALEARIDELETSLREEVARSVPEEAARIIREEIQALAQDLGE